MVDGTGYEIKSGKTLVGGTAYEVGFEKPIVKIRFPQGTNHTFDVNEHLLTLSEFVSESDDEEVYGGKIYEVAVGTQLHCKINRTHTGDLYILVNGVEVKHTQITTSSGTDGTVEFTHIISKDTVVYNGSVYDGAQIHICEVQNDPVTVTITSDGAGGRTYLDINGNEYYENQTMEVPAGTVITCYNRGSIYLNGYELARDYTYSTFFNYIATKNCKISLYEGSNSGQIYITEET